VSSKDNSLNKAEPEENLSADSSFESLPLETLFNRYGIERSHADNVARNALEFFDVLKEYHGLDPELRNFLEIAALVHDIGVNTDLENHHKAGRDILLRHPPSEVPKKFKPAIPWVAFLHRKRVGEEKLLKLQKKEFGKMPEDVQAITLKISALLRLADALDYSRMGSKLGEVKLGKRNVRLEIKGEGATIDAERLKKKSDLWDLLYNTELEFKPESI